MKKNDIIRIIIFILLIIAIIFMLGINSYKNRKLDNVDRKIEYIMGYTYDTILNKGESLYTSTINLLSNDNIFEYSENLDGSIKKYSINNETNYKLINNFSIAINNFTNNTLLDYMEYKNIIYFENDYYIKNKRVLDNNYIGSILDIDSYNDNKINFKVINYYCDNHKFVGVLDKIPKCNYVTNESYFNIVLENNLFKVSSIDNFKIFIK